MIPVRSRPSLSGTHPLAGSGASLGPLRLLEPASIRELADVLAQALSLGLVLSPWRRPAVLEMASAAAHRRARLYLIGPPDLGRELAERAWLRDHARRLLSRRGVACAADLMLLNSGTERTGLLFFHDAACSYWVWLSERQAEAAADWFSHLFWHQCSEEGRAQGSGYRFQRCGSPPFQVAALPPGAPLYLTRSPLPRVAETVALAHEPGQRPELGLPPFAVSPGGGCIDARAADGGWSLRLQLDAPQARALHDAAAVVLTQAPDAR